MKIISNRYNYNKLVWYHVHAWNFPRAPETKEDITPGLSPPFTQYINCLLHSTFKNMQLFMRDQRTLFYMSCKISQEIYIKIKYCFVRACLRKLRLDNITCSTLCNYHQSKCSSPLSSPNLCTIRHDWS